MHLPVVLHDTVDSVLRVSKDAADLLPPRSNRSLSQLPLQREKLFLKDCDPLFKSHR